MAGDYRDASIQMLQFDYDVIRTVGQGATGRCFLARRKRLGVGAASTYESVEGCYVMKKVPLKHNIQYLPHDMAHEANILRGLSHPCIVKFVDAFVSSDRSFCLVTEYAPGGELHYFAVTPSV